MGRGVRAVATLATLPALATSEHPFVSDPLRTFTSAKTSPPCSAGHPAEDVFELEVPLMRTPPGTFGRLRDRARVRRDGKRDGQLGIPTTN